MNKVHVGTYIPYTGYYPACMPGLDTKVQLSMVREQVTCKRCRKHWLDKPREWYG